MYFFDVSVFAISAIGAASMFFFLCILGALSDEAKTLEHGRTALLVMAGGWFFGSLPLAP